MWGDTSKEKIGAGITCVARLIFYSSVLKGSLIPCVLLSCSRQNHTWALLSLPKIDLPGLKL